VVAFDVAVDEQAGAVQGGTAVRLPDRAAADDVDQPGLVLQADEEDPSGGGRPLADRCSREGGAKLIAWLSGKP